MDINLILEGGGVLGISYIGAYKALVEKGYNIKKCAGTSIGSLMSALIVAGYTPEEMDEVFLGDEFKDFLKCSGLEKKIRPYQALNIFLKKGIYSTGCIEKFVDKLLKRKGISTFGDIEDGSLTIIAADVTNRKLVVMPDDLEKYGIDKKSFKIAKAVSMSCAMPLLFTPSVIKDGNRLNYIVDGGLLSNFPVWVFDINDEERGMTYAIKIDEKPSNTSEGKMDIISYALDILNTPLNDDRVVYIRDKERLKVINIRYNRNIKSTQFYKISECSGHLYLSGYNDVKNYIDNLKG